jgi:hypothetical protein
VKVSVVVRKKTTPARLLYTTRALDAAGPGVRVGEAASPLVTRREKGNGLITWAGPRRSRCYPGCHAGICLQHYYAACRHLLVQQTALRAHSAAMWDDVQLSNREYCVAMGMHVKSVQ